jgi:tRNA (cmo5U34)-methyltransferase
MRRLVPFYDEQRDIILRLLPYGRSDRLHVLDLGSGPGLTAARILDEYVNSTVTVFDLTEEMLEECRVRFGGDTRVRYRHGDFRSDDFGTGFDAIIASLSLHHLTLEERPDCLRRAYAALSDGGVLIAAEVVVESSAAVRDHQYQLWRAHMIANGEDGASWFERHRRKDHPAPIEELTRMLMEAGFETAACYWRYLNFAIIVAQKPR